MTKITFAVTENRKKVLIMAEYFAGGHLRFVNGEWRDDNGDAIEISRVRHGRWILEAHDERGELSVECYCRMFRML